MNLQFNAAAIINDEVYFSAKNFNGLFKWDLNTNDVNLIGHFPKEKLWGEHLHQFAVYYDDIIYFIPYFGQHITKYDIKTGEFSCLPIEEGDVYFGISHVLKYENRYVFVPRKLRNPVGIFYPESGVLEKISFVNESELSIFYSDIFCATIVDGGVYIPVYDTALIIKCDLANREISKISLGDMRVSSITYYNDKFWVISASGKIIRRYSENFDIEKEYCVFGGTERPYECWVQYSKKLYLCGCLDESLIFYDTNSDSWKEIYRGERERVNNKWAFMCGYQAYNDKLFIYPSSSNCMYVLNHGKIVNLYFEYNEFDLQEEIQRGKNKYYFDDCKDQIHYEGEYVVLNDLINYMENF